MILDEDGKNEDPRHTPKGSPLHPRAHKVGARDDSHHQAGVGSESNPSTPPRNAQSRGPPGVAKTEESAAVRANFLFLHVQLLFILSAALVRET